MKNMLSSTCMLALTVLGSGAFAAAPDPTEIFIERLSYNGSGCPPGSTDVRLAGDGSGFRLRFNNEFIARAGSGRPLSDARKNCQINLALHVPQGFTFAIAALDFRGRARLASGATGTQRVNHYFQGEADDTSATRLFTGPFSGPWHTRHVIPLVELVWAPCGMQRSLNINASVRVAPGDANPNASSFMSVDSERGTLEHFFQFSWRRCE